jgi:anti-anti-sigma regulatory factor
VISQTKEDVVLKVEGWVSGANVALLEEEGTRLLGESECLVLDLEGVRFIDRPGLGLLKRWSGARLALRGASPFVHMRLAAHGLA